MAVIYTDEREHRLLSREMKSLEYIRWKLRVVLVADMSALYVMGLHGLCVVTHYFCDHHQYSAICVTEALLLVCTT